MVLVTRPSRGLEVSEIEFHPWAALTCDGIVNT